MTSFGVLFAEIRKDPAATFEVEIDLPGGGMAVGTIGPAIGNRVMASVRLPDGATDQQAEFAHSALNHMMGGGSAISSVSRGQEEHDAALQKAREFLDGGKG